jgi:zinc D-Ala-D-Ala carboxypeptidase
VSTPEHPRSLRRAIAAPIVVLLLVVSATLGAPTASAAATFTDVADSPFAADIEWLAAAGITAGCTAERFCPGDPVTREQMASFLVRMFELPPTAVEPFTDVAASGHRTQINRLAAAGITGGCAPDRFCPRGLVTREQMASFIARAAGLPWTANDYFLDDERSIHKGDINRSAAAGVTGGCGQHVYCPRQEVTRGQMAAFLRRVVSPVAAPTPLPAVGPLPACRYDDILTTHRTYEDWGRSLLDPISMLPSTYAPGDLLDTGSLGLNGGHRVRALVGDDLRQLAAAARAAGAPIAVQSAYRSYDAQVATFNYWVSKVGYAAALTRSARPGHSEHQLGTAVDFRSAGGGPAWDLHDWAATPAGAWMRDNAWRYGFVMSYPRNATAVTCYDYEPWHYRYLGRSAASAIRQSGLPLREWLWRLGYGS